MLNFLYYIHISEQLILINTIHNIMLFHSLKLGKEVHAKLNSKDGFLKENEAMENENNKLSEDYHIKENENKKIGVNIIYHCRNTFQGPPGIG